MRNLVKIKVKSKIYNRFASPDKATNYQVEIFK